MPMISSILRNKQEKMPIKVKKLITQTNFLNIVGKDQIPLQTYIDLSKAAK